MFRLAKDLINISTVNWFENTFGCAYICTEKRQPSVSKYLQYECVHLATLHFKIITTLLIENTCMSMITMNVAHHLTNLYDQFDFL